MEEYNKWFRVKLLAKTALKKCKIEVYQNYSLELIEVEQQYWKTKIKMCINKVKTSK